MTRCAWLVAAWSLMQFHPAVASTASRLLVLDAVTVAQRVVAVGDRGIVLMSDDQGRHWRAQHIAGDAALTAITRVGNTLWAVGHDAIIVKSTDGGQHWRRVHDAPDRQTPLLGVLFIDALHGFAVGAYGTFLESRDGGEHWLDRRITQQDFHYNAIVRLGDGTLVIAGEHGTLLRSVDDGARWQPLASPYAGSWFGALPVGAHGVLVFGLRGQLWRSDDAGLHWVVLPIATSATLEGGHVLDDGTLAIVGYDGVVLLSTDQAQHFSVHHQPGSVAYASVLGNRHDMMLFGERGVERVRFAR
jgi:photosystem II stability/assembly factor-like uncharacterized protein